MSANDAIQDEVTSLNAIFDEGTLSPIDEDTRVYSLRLPSLPSITLRIEFPADYPNAPPSVLGTQSVGQDVPKGMGNRAVDVVRHVLARIYQPGEACIYDLLEEAREALEQAEEQGDLRLNDQHENGQIEEEETSLKDPVPSIDLGPEPPWIIAPALTEKKSVFLARVAPVSSPTQARQYVAHLLATDKKAARATHNMTAWRIKGPNETSYQDCDDDGETAAGSRMLHLMQLMDVWNVMVVVTRWYGGILLGPDRFRIINTAAREALVLGGFTKETKDGDGRKKGKK
ncbi:impact family [Pyrenophora seminiperda CCB06]|uniref:Impact family n=1 Tax=Pyrenophora seminiperda CCB06 TaxID=1302712 RepID=A0A3M7M144_9PLEO|nr:impact family [Pyrenophora seminiperda CCB06]